MEGPAGGVACLSQTAAGLLPPRALPIEPFPPKQNPSPFSDRLLGGEQQRPLARSAKSSLKESPCERRIDPAEHPPKSLPPLAHHGLLPLSPSRRFRRSRRPNFPDQVLRLPLIAGNDRLDLP